MARECALCGRCQPEHLDDGGLLCVRFYFWYLRDSRGKVILCGETQRIKPKAVVVTNAKRSGS